MKSTQTVFTALALALGALTTSTAVAQDKVAVLAFDHKGSAEMAERVRTVIGESLSSGGFALVETADVDEAAKGVVVGGAKVDSAMAKRLGDKTGAGWIITGKVFKAGDTTFLLAKILDASSDSVLASTQQFSAAADMEGAIAALSADVITQLSEGGK